MADDNPDRSAPGAANPAPATPPRSTPAPTPRVYRKPQRGRNTIILVVIVVALIIGGIFLWRYLGSYESTDDAQADVHLYPVSARVSGHVIKVNVDDNQWVEAGTVLVEIDPKDYEVAVAQAKAALASAVATAQSLNITVPITTINTTSQLTSADSDVVNANSGIIAYERQLTAAHAQLEAAEANDAKSQADLVRYKMLVDKGEVSKQIYDQAVAAAKSSTASVAAASATESAAQQFVEQARSRLTQATANKQSAETGPQQVSSTKSRVSAALADVEQRRQQLEQAQLNLQYTKIVAPVSGEVDKTVVVGLNVQAGQQLLTVVPLDEVWVTANFKETQLRHMRVGQKAEIHIDSTGQTLKGHVDSIAGATGPLFSLFPPQNATGNYVKIVQRVPVKIVLESGENHDHQLRPGMNVVPDIILQ
jgi:membrane fusion protein (multidrug efflux system)